EKVKQFLDWNEALQCGVDLMDERIFHCPV
ncbi:MAG TPA: MBL fold metallo-hydrolase, partial [Acinetobacter radioresistens]|nr:MBL fold metallo-hydrolase [Acinetobacter radioresistens]